MEKRGIALAAGILALFVAAACMAIPEYGQAPVAATVTSQPDTLSDSDGPTPPPTSELPATAEAGSSTESETSAPSGENIALLGIGRASTWSENAYLAVDGDLDTMWSAEELAFQWLSVILGDSYLVNRIQMVVAQAPAGPTTHEVWLGNSSNTRALYKRFTDIPTEDGQTLDVVIDPPLPAIDVLINTVDSPSWVAWREVRIFGSPSADFGEENGPPEFRLERIAAGLDLPVQVTHAGDGSGRLFVVEQRGRIRIIRDGVLGDRPFLDISEQVTCCTEQGLINVVFPPDYAAKQHFYVSYTDLEGHTVISRFRTASDPDRADAESEEIVLKIEQPHHFHNGGRMVFGPRDGYLYLGSGDGGSPYDNDHEKRGQGTDTLLGKILRIDVESDVRPYAIPADNPFFGVDGYRDEIWALGLRNPWGFAFDSETGDFYIPDVGNYDREEVNFQEAGSRGGENYGWRNMEGSRCVHFLPLPCSPEGMTGPVAEYDHLNGCAVVGGVVYRGDRLPQLQSAFIYADFCRGHVWRLERPAGNDTDGWQSRILLNARVPISSVGEDEGGNVYVTGYQDGVVAMVKER